MEAFAKAEKTKKPHWKEMFTDVYQDMPDQLRKQMDDMEQVIQTYPDAYPMSQYADGPDPTAK